MLNVFFLGMFSTESWTDLIHLHSTDPKDHSGIIGFLSDVMTRLQNMEYLRQVIAEQSDTEQDKNYGAG